MIRFTKIAFAALVATVSMAFAVSSASAANATLTSPSSLTASSTNLTLTVSSLATVTGTTSLGVSLTPGAYSSSGTLVQVGSITSAAITVGSPANTTVTPSNTPWPITWKGETVSGGLRLYALNVLLVVRSGVLSKTCTGGFAFSINSAGTVDTIDSSVTLACTGSSTATLAGSLTNSTAVVYNL